MADRDDTRDDGTDTSARLIGWAVVIVGLSILAYFAWFVGHRIPVSDKTEAWGQFGDYIGGIAGSAIAAMALVLLRETVRLQRLTLETMKSERDATLSALRQQEFDGQFFTLVRLISQAHPAPMIQDATNDNWAILRKQLRAFEKSGGEPQRSSALETLAKYEWAIQPYLNLLDTASALLVHKGLASRDLHWNILRSLINGYDAAALKTLLAMLQLPESLAKAITDFDLTKQKAPQAPPPAPVAP